MPIWTVDAAGTTAPIGPLVYDVDAAGTQRRVNSIWDADAAGTLSRIWVAEQNLAIDTSPLYMANMGESNTYRGKQIGQADFTAFNRLEMVFYGDFFWTSNPDVYAESKCGYGSAFVGDVGGWAIANHYVLHNGNGENINMGRPPAVAVRVFDITYVNGVNVLVEYISIRGGGMSTYCYTQSARLYNV